MLRLSKLAVIILLVSLAVIFTACVPQTELRSYTSETQEEMHTLKKETELRRRTLVWTSKMREVEEVPEPTDRDKEKVVMEAEMTAAIKFGNTMTESEPAPSSNNAEGPLFSEKLSILVGERQKNVYPVMPGLGGMDLSQMSSAIYSKLTDFLTGVKNKNIRSDNSMFSQKYIGVIFLYELGFYPAITSWYIGTPFISGNNIAGVEDTYEIPVLCLTNSGKFMCWISIDASKAFQSAFLIKQIVLGDLS